MRDLFIRFGWIAGVLIVVYIVLYAVIRIPNGPWISTLKLYDDQSVVVENACKHGSERISVTVLNYDGDIGLVCETAR